MTLFVKYLKKHYNSVFCYQFWNPLWVSNDSLMTFLQTSDRGILDFDKLMHKYPNKLFTDKKNIKLKCYENFQQKYWALFWRSVLILSWDSQNVKCLKLLFDAETRNNYKTFSKVSSVSPNFILNIFPTPKWYCLWILKSEKKNPFFLKDTVLLPEYEVGDTADWAIWKCDWDWPPDKSPFVSSPYKIFS